MNKTEYDSPAVDYMDMDSIKLVAASNPLNSMQVVEDIPADNSQEALSKESVQEENDTWDDFETDN
mgnify:CR=1 FL=1